LKKRTALLEKLREIFRRFTSQPVERVVERIDPILRGWVNCFAVGHSSPCFSFVKDWVEKKVRRHLMRAPEAEGLRLAAVEVGDGSAPERLAPVLDPTERGLLKTGWLF
jgi:hypothetical protein